MSQHRQLKRELRKTMLDVAENLSRNDVRKIEFAQHLVDTRWSTTASSDAQQRDGMAVLEELQRRRVWNVDLRQRVCELTELHELLTDIGRPDLIGKLICLENFLHRAWSHNHGSLPRSQSPTSLPALVVRSPDAEAAYGDLETDSAAHCTLSDRGSLRATRTSSHRSSSWTNSDSASSSKSPRSPHCTSRRRHQSDTTTYRSTTAVTPPLAPKADGRCNGHFNKTYKHSCGFTGAFEALLSLLRIKHNK